MAVGKIQKDESVSTKQGSFSIKLGVRYGGDGQGAPDEDKEMVRE